MGSAYVPTYTTESQYVGNTTIANPLMFLSVNGTVYTNGYKAVVTGGARNYYLTFDSSTGNIYLVCNTIVFSADTPSATLTNVEVLVIG